MHQRLQLIRRSIGADIIAGAPANRLTTDRVRMLRITGTTAVRALAAVLLLNGVPPSAASAITAATVARAVVEQAGREPGSSIRDLDASAAPALRAPDAAGKRPNIVVILLDDAGFASTSMFGGLAQTPAFERLASNGIRYNRFNVTAICSPTRAALLSGRNPHEVGFGQIPETAANYPGYNAQWPKTAATVAEHLRRLGYGTAAIGKWHNTPAADWSPVGPFDRWPTGLGFDYFYGTIGTTSMWEPLLWRGTNSVQPNKTAEQGYNLTTDITDDAIAWLHIRESLVPDKPYFLYFATTATHSPHQVADRWIDPYRGHFNAGWDVLRETILARQKKLGLVPERAALAPRDKAVPPWTSLSPAEKIVAERQMEILAGFMSQTDHEVGRLIDTIRKGPGGANTLIFFIAGDNGSSGEDGSLGCDDCPQPPPRAAARISYLDTLAGPDHIAGSAAGWAVMNNTPFPGMKRQASYLGGLRTPLIVSWPGHTINNNIVRSQWIDVNDIAATIYDLLGYSVPDKIDGIKQLPIEGVSFSASFVTPDSASTHYRQYFETFGTRSIYADGWMGSLRYYDRPWGGIGHGPDTASNQWELYDLEDDFSQAHNIAASNPGKMQQLITLFNAEAARNHVFPAGELHLWYDQLPSLTHSRTDLTFYPDEPNLIWDANPDFRRAYRLTASVDLPDNHATGLIASSGMRGRGFALYMTDGAVVFEGEHGVATTVSSTQLLRRGKHTILVYVSASSDYGGHEDRSVQVLLDGQTAAKGTVPEGAEPFYGSASLSIGSVRGSPVSRSALPPFSGTIDRVQVHFANPNAQLLLER